MRLPAETIPGDSAPRRAQGQSAPTPANDMTKGWA